jgi:hypothetical protein
MDEVFDNTSDKMEKVSNSMKGRRRKNVVAHTKIKSTYNEIIQPTTGCFPFSLQFRLWSGTTYFTVYL